MQSELDDTIDELRTILGLDGYQKEIEEVAQNKNKNFVENVFEILNKLSTEIPHIENSTQNTNLINFSKVAIKKENLFDNFSNYVKVEEFKNFNLNVQEKYPSPFLNVFNGKITNLENNLEERKTSILQNNSKISFSNDFNKTVREYFNNPNYTEIKSKIKNQSNVKTINSDYNKNYNQEKSNLSNVRNIEIVENTTNPSKVKKNYNNNTNNNYKENKNSKIIKKNENSQNVKIIEKTADEFFSEAVDVLKEKNNETEFKDNYTPKLINNKKDFNQNNKNSWKGKDNNNYKEKKGNDNNNYYEKKGNFKNYNNINTNGNAESNFNQNQNNYAKPYDEYYQDEYSGNYNNGYTNNYNYNGQTSTNYNKKKFSNNGSKNLYVKKNY